MRWMLLIAGWWVGLAAGRAAEAWTPLFDGKALGGWAASGFEAGGAVKMEPAFRGGPGAIVIEAGLTLSGVTWQRGGELPRSNYEVELEAMKLEGDDFFCGLTFPVGRSAATFVVGGWGGTVVGISSLDRIDAAENETSRTREFAPNRWYRIRVRVTDAHLEAWIDDEPIVDVALKDRVVSLRPGEIQRSLPLGIATYMTRAAVRGMRIRRLSSAEANP
jgi:hypothetical protein